MSSDSDDRDGESRRAIARRQTRKAGDRSAKLARTLMEVKDSVLGKLDLDEDVLAEITTARAITSQIARRRAERTVAGALRHVDLVDLAAKLTNIEETGNADPRMFHLAEMWRTKLVEGGMAAAADFPGDTGEPLAQLIVKAQSERDKGKPPGAGRALFRHVVAMLKAGPKS